LVSDQRQRRPEAVKRPASATLGPVELFGEQQGTV
jgi:hypothetical protein